MPGYWEWGTDCGINEKGIVEKGIGKLKRSEKRDLLPRTPRIFPPYPFPFEPDACTWPRNSIEHPHSTISCFLSPNDFRTFRSINDMSGWCVGINRSWHFTSPYWRTMSSYLEILICVRMSTPKLKKFMFLKGHVRGGDTGLKSIVM
jgi:hypothetical protein